MSKIDLSSNPKHPNKFVRFLMDSFSITDTQVLLDKLGEFEGLDIAMDYGGELITGKLEITEKFIIIWKKTEIDEPRSWWSIEIKRKNIKKILSFRLNKPM